MVTEQNFYAVLGIPQNATQKEIDQAYYKLYHELAENLANVTEVKEKIQEVKKAYAVLNDIDKRKDYDASLKNQWEDSKIWVDGMMKAPYFTGYHVYGKDPKMILVEDSPFYASLLDRTEAEREKIIREFGELLNFSYSLANKTEHWSDSFVRRVCDWTNSLNFKNENPLYLTMAIRKFKTFKDLREQEKEMRQPDAEKEEAINLRRNVREKHYDWITFSVARILSSWIVTHWQKDSLSTNPDYQKSMEEGTIPELMSLYDREIEARIHKEHKTVYDNCYLTFYQQEIINIRSHIQQLQQKVVIGINPNAA